MNARTTSITTDVTGRMAAIAIVVAMLLLSLFGGAAIGQADDAHVDAVVVSS